MSIAAAPASAPTQSTFRFKEVPLTETAELDGRYNALNAVERSIVDNWIKGGITKQDALDMLYDDLADAAEEDGYDGP